MKIKKFSKTEFMLECDNLEESKKIRRLKSFEYKGETYQVNSIHEGFNITGYYSFMVSVKEKPGLPEERLPPDA